MRRSNPVLITLAMLALFSLNLFAPALYSARPSGNWYVATIGNDLNDCVTPSTPCATINGAIEKAAGGDTIKVATAIYVGGDIEVVSIHKDITLSGGWNSSFTQQIGTSIIDGQGVRAGIAVYYDWAPATAIIERFTIQNGRTVPYSTSSGGISVGGNLVLNNSSILNNVSVYGGGGIHNLGVTTINNSTISANLAQFSSGGGILNWHAWDGGGILSLNNVTLADNKADGEGGGIANPPGARYESYSVPTH